jgi:hypothetical protein
VKEILLILAVAACPLSMLAMGAVAWLATKLMPGRPKNAGQPASAAPAQKHGLGAGT